MIEFFQITGSSSFAVRAALEEGGIPYGAHDVHPRNRADDADFVAVAPRMRVPLIRDDEVTVYETGAILLYLVERFPQAQLGPQPGEPGRGDLLRWVVYLSNTLHTIHYPVQYPGMLTTQDIGHEGISAKGLAQYEDAGAYLEAQLTGRQWCLGDTFSVADIYLYMLKGWESYGSPPLGGEAVEAHYERTGARPGIARARELDDLDENLRRHHPEMRGGKPV